MPITKKHDEFYTLDMASGWETPPGYPKGIAQKILSSDFSDAKKSGFRTRLLKFEAGEYTTVPFVHDHWEEVFLVSGDLIVGNDAQGNGGERFSGFTYACRPPGAYHGPFKSEGGCLLLEQHYYDFTEPRKPAKKAAANKGVKKGVKAPAKKAARTAAKGGSAKKVVAKKAGARKRAKRKAS
jgi:hypothetical protein